MDIEKLSKYKNDLEAAAKEFGKSTRTIRRWLERYDLYEPQEKYRPGKLSKEKAAEIRQLEGLTQQELAEKFGVSQAMIGRILNNIAYKEGLRIGGKAEIRFGGKAY